MTELHKMTHVQKLEAFRKILVAERRRIVTSVLEIRQDNKETNPTEGAARGAEFKRTQDEIEAVDRAIKEEKAFDDEKARSAAAAHERAPEPEDYPDA